MAIHSVPIFDVPHLRVLGRTAPDQKVLTLFWTASGLELSFTGSELWLEVKADYATMEPWLSIELDGAWICRFPVNKGASRFCVFRGMAVGPAKHVRIFKDTQAMHDDPHHLLQITALGFADGEFLPLPAPAMRLEFIGDSITSGEGAIGAVPEEDWISAFFTAENHYARMTADALKAEYRIVSQSGWGIVSGWDNDPRHALPRFYEQVCGLAEGTVNADCGAQQAYDFSAKPVDIVVINLGTNDDGALHNSAWHDPETGNTYKQELADDGGIAPTAATLKKTVADFLATVRRCNPNARIVWAYGMLGDFLYPLLADAIAHYKALSGDQNATLLKLPNTTDATVGARQHPGVKSHRAAAKVLTEFIKQSL